MTERVQRFFAVQAEQDSELGPRQVRLRASTEALGRDGLVVVTRGIDLEPYKSNPVMLFEHDPKMPVARALDVSIDNDALIVLAEFAPEGVSAKADEVCGLVKSGIVSGISCGLGFNSADTERVDPKNRAAGTRLLRSELREISFCGVPADKNSLVLERADDDEDEAQTERAVDTVDASSTVERAGAKFSAASKAKMDEMMGHLAAARECVARAEACHRDMMDEDAERDMDEGGEEMRAVGVDGAAADGSIAVAVLSPAERFRRQLALLDLTA